MDADDKERLRKLEEAQKQFAQNQELTMRMIRIIMQDMGLRDELKRLDKEMEAMATNNGSVPPVSVDIDGG